MTPLQPSPSTHAEPRPPGSDPWSRSHAGRRTLQSIGLLACGALLASPLAHADTVLLGGERLGSAELLACEIAEGTGSATLLVGGQRRTTTGLVRWGAPAEVGRATALVFTGGSRLLSDRAWSPIGLARVDQDSVRIRRGRGWVDFARNSVRWVVLDAEAAGLRLGTLSGDAGEEAEDLVLLADGDRLLGRVVELTNDKLRITVGSEPVETPLESVAAVRLAGESDRVEAACLVGWADGSLVRADRLRVADGVAEVDFAGATLASKTESLTLVQPLGTSVRYLSDLEPVDYRHTPYLDLVWPYTRDTNLRGGPLVGGGCRRAKGLAVHSAARLVYRLDGSPQRFYATIAVGDPPIDSSAVGSVVVRVYLVKDGGFVPVYDSGIVRAGDPATPIDLDATDAAALTLVIDYADRGDAGDEALWLDARLEPQVESDAATDAG